MTSGVYVWITSLLDLNIEIRKRNSHCFILCTQLKFNIVVCKPFYCSLKSLVLSFDNFFPLTYHRNVFLISSLFCIFLHFWLLLRMVRIESSLGYQWRMLFWVKNITVICFKNIDTLIHGTLLIFYKNIVIIHMKNRYNMVFVYSLLYLYSVFFLYILIVLVFHRKVFS